MEYGSVIAECVACGEFIDYCQGHGEIGDPVGFAMLLAHDDGEHEWSGFVRSRFAGTLHRKCLVVGCGFITLDA